MDKVKKEKKALKVTKEDDEGKSLLPETQIEIEARIKAIYESVFGSGGKRGSSGSLVALLTEVEKVLDDQLIEIKAIQTIHSAKIDKEERDIVKNRRAERMIYN
jgi:cobalamin biosynthesis protein CbiG